MFQFEENGIRIFKIRYLAKIDIFTLSNHIAPVKPGNNNEKRMPKS